MCWLPHPNLRLFLLVGFLGGYTTFSTFAFESLTLWERGETGLSLANLAGSVVAGFVAVAPGVGQARSVLLSTPSARSPLTTRPGAGRPIGHHRRSGREP